MKRILSILLLLGLFVPALQARQYVNDLDIKVLLDTTGTAHITEVWNVSVDEGTEWYLVRSNLGDIEVLNLAVKDETGRQYVNEGSWDVDRSIDAKAGRCGIVRKSNGCEICWGLGSHGDHTYTVTYDMTNVVKSLNDYDCLHMQFVSPGLSASVAHVEVRIAMANGTVLSDDNARAWGFGCEGELQFVGGDVDVESSQFDSRSSVIVLIRFDKGLFSSTSVVDKDFDEELQTAMEGADFGDEDEDEFSDSDFRNFILSVIAMFAAVFGIAKISDRNTKKNVLGVTSTKDIDWSRTVPFGGNVLEADYVLNKVEGKSSTKSNTIASALILRMIQKGNLTVGKDADGKIEISFNDSVDQSGLSTSAKELYNMMKEASGSDVILQDKEFSRWSKKHTSTVSDWVTTTKSVASSQLVRDGSMSASGKFTEDGQKNARDVFGFRKYIKDFTLVGERQSIEVTLWQDLLVFGALYGMADKVAKELKDIKPEYYEQQGGTLIYDQQTLYDLIWMTNRLGNSITNAQNLQAQKVARNASGGFGGHTSFGGGGGFSGGGFGGGAR